MGLANYKLQVGRLQITDSLISRTSINDKSRMVAEALEATDWKNFELSNFKL